MVDKAFSGLPGQGALSGNEIFAIENADGNSRKITATRVRNFMLNAHAADTEAHGISAFFATLTASEDLEALLDLLGFEQVTSGAYKIPFDLLIQFGKHPVGTSGSSAINGTFTLPTEFADTDYVILGTMDGQAQGAGLWGAYTCSIGPDDESTVHFTVDTTNADEPIEIARNLQWFAIGNAPA